jgi:Predicted aminoglycoside phosphotransferase
MSASTAQTAGLPPGFDVGRLEQYLHAHVEGYAGPLQVQRFPDGQSNPTYLLATPTQRYVLRKKPHGQLLPSAHAVEREYRVIRALHGRGVPVARPYCLCEDDAVVGTPFYAAGSATPSTGVRRRIMRLVMPANDRTAMRLATTAAGRAGAARASSDRDTP